MAGVTLADLLRKELGVGTVTLRNRSLSQVGTSVVTIARQSPNRLVLDVVNLSVNALFVLDERNVSSTRGYRVAPSGGTLHLWWKEDGERVGYEWFALAAAAGSDVLIVETLVSTEPAGA